MRRRLYLSSPSFSRRHLTGTARLEQPIKLGRELGADIVHFPLRDGFAQDFDHGSRVKDGVWQIGPLALTDTPEELLQREALAHCRPPASEMLSKLRWELCREVFGFTPSKPLSQRLQRGTGSSLGGLTRTQASAVLHLSNELVMFHVVLLFDSNCCWSPSFRLLAPTPPHSMVP
jgi:hypothetical protein